MLCMSLFSVCDCCVFWFWASFQELAQQIKLYQARINELCEKSHNLAERSADLGPLCARKLYHTGDRETRVLDLVNTLNAPLEPYVSPLVSPGSPDHSIKSQYENPLKLFKNVDLSPFETKDYDSASNVSARDDNTSKKSKPSAGSLSSVSPQRPSSEPFERIKPTKLFDPSVETIEISVAVPQSSALQPKRAHSSDRALTEQPKFKLQRSNDGDSFEIGSVKSGSTEDPRSSVTRSHDPDREDSVSLSSHPLTLSEDAASLGNQMPSPAQSEGKRRPFGKLKDDSVSDMSEKDLEVKHLPEELLTLKQRKEEALAPYKPKSKHFAAQLGIDEHGDTVEREYYDTLANDFNDRTAQDDTNRTVSETDKPVTMKETQRASRSPFKADHKLGPKDTILTRTEMEPRFMSSPVEGRRSYKPRSPSPLTLPPISRSHHDISQKRTSSLDKPSQRSSSVERLRGHRSLSPKTVAMTRSPRSHEGQENKGSLSKSLTAGQMRSMGAPANKVKLSKDAWDSVGACLLNSKCQGHFRWESTLLSKTQD